MKELFASIDWKSMGYAILSWLLSVVVLYAIIPNIKKIPEATGKFFDWLGQQAAHVKGQFAAQVLGRIVELARQAVLVAENIAIQDLKDQAASGKISPADLLVALKKIKDDVISQVVTHATAQGLWKLAIGIFNGDADALKNWLDDTVEAHVAELPPSGLQTVHPMLEAKGNLSSMELGAEIRRKTVK